MRRKIGDDVGVTDCQGQERVGCVLDEFGAADGGQRSSPLVASGICRRGPGNEISFRDGTMISRRVAALFSSSTPTTMRSGNEIRDRCAFAKEFGIGCD